MLHLLQAIIQFLVNEVKTEKLGETLNAQINRYVCDCELGTVVADV